MHLHLQAVLLVLLEAGIHDVTVLASHLVESEIQTRLASFLKLGGLELLGIRVHLRRVLRGLVLLR